MKFIEMLADALDNASRLGTETDVPECSRYIIVSDTLAKEWANKLREAAQEDGNG